MPKSGANAVTVRVRDADSACGTQSFSIQVANTNDAPTITSTPVTTATEDAAYSYDVHATDPDVGDTLTYSLTTAPTGMTINAHGPHPVDADQRPDRSQCGNGPCSRRGWDLCHTRLLDHYECAIRESTGAPAQLCRHDVQPTHRRHDSSCECRG